MRHAQTLVQPFFIALLCVGILWFPWARGQETPILGAVTLIAHEGSHAIMRWAPEWIYFAAGTVGQLLFPLLIGIAGWRQGSWWAIPFGLAWFASACRGAATYIADAQAQALPLLSDSLTHDWNYLLIDAYYHPTWIAPLSNGVVALGWIGGAAGIAYCVWKGAQAWRTVPESL
jgi:hypothetical protein